MIPLKSLYIILISFYGIVHPASVREESFVTESVTSNIVNDEVTPTPEPEYIIRYPVTPEPNENDTKVIPPGIVIDNKPGRMTEQKIITGDVDCTCGRPLSKIVGGDNATINELPWTVALMRKKPDGTIRGPYCGVNLQIY